MTATNQLTGGAKGAMRCGGGPYRRHWPQQHLHGVCASPAAAVDMLYLAGLP